MHIHRGCYFKMVDEMSLGSKFTFSKKKKANMCIVKMPNKCETEVYR